MPPEANKSQAVSADLPLDLVHKLPEWREKYGPDLFYIPQYRVVLRPFTRVELIRLEANTSVDPVGAEIGLLQRCLVYPEWSKFAESVSLSSFHGVFQALWRASGFRDPENFAADLNKMRMLVLEKDHTIIRTICNVFPAYKLSDIDQLPRNEILYLLAQAEVTRGVTFDGQDLEKVYAALQKQAIMEEKKNRRAGNAREQRKSRFFDWQRDAVEQDQEIEDQEAEILRMAHERRRK